VATYFLTGWSTTPTADWTLSTSLLLADFDPFPSLSSTTIGNGGVVTLTLYAPCTATSGQAATVVVGSAPDGVSLWPVFLSIQ
jgi:hypothetical protein